MNHYLVGQGYWSYIIGAHENKPKSHMPTTQRASKERVGHYTAWQHVYKTTCFATFATPRRPKRRGKISKRFSPRTHPARVEQHTPKRDVCDGLHRQDQEHLRLAWLHQRQHRRRRDGASMLGRPRATIQLVENGNLGERYPSLVLQPPINAIGRRKPRPIKDQHIRRTNALLRYGWFP